MTTFASLRVRNYRLYFFGSLISNNGTWIQRIAQDWLVYSLTGSAQAVGIVTALQFGPMLVLGLFSGLLADRYPQRLLLLFGQYALATLAAAMATITLTGIVTVTYIYLLALGVGLATVVESPARQSFVGVMVGNDLMRNAVALNTSSFQSARITGPAIAAVMIGVTGPGWAFALNAASYLAVIAMLLMMRTSELHPMPRAGGGPGAVLEGLRYVRARPSLTWTIVLVFFVGCFGFNFPVILTAYVGEVLNGDASMYGWLNTTMAVGSLAGALLSARASALPVRTLLTIGGVFGLLLIATAAAPWLPLLLPLLALSGLTGVAFNSLANASLQTASEPIIRGRVIALYLIVFLGATTIGAPLIGWITAHWGAPIALAVCGAACTAAAIVCTAAVQRAATRTQAAQPSI